MGGSIRARRLEMSWINHFAIAGELIRIEQATKDPATGRHRAFLENRLCARTLLPACGPSMIRAMVEDHLNSVTEMGEWHKKLFVRHFCPTFPIKWSGRFQPDGEPIPERVISGGWEWRKTEQIWNENLEAFTGGIWYRHYFDVLKSYEWGTLKMIGQEYKGAEKQKDPVKVYAGQQGGRPKKSA